MVTSTSAKDLNVFYYLHHKKPLWNAIAFLYIFGAYAGGIVFLLLPNGWLNALGVVLLTHSMVLAAYMAHEFMHGTIFMDMKWNDVGGNIMLWLTGGCYARFRDLAKDHIAHHTKRVDFSAFNLPDFMKALPSPMQGLILALEWLYFPAISYILQWQAIAAPFLEPQRRDERLRVTLMLIVRALLFALLGLASLKALVLYFLSFTGMILMLRLIDAFQHTYEVFPMGTPLPQWFSEASPEESRAYEHTNTFTTLISQRYWWLNLLLLNFGYHNAHHELMKCPWYSLHELDQEFSAQQKIHYLKLPQVLANYHRFRINRIFLGQGQAIDQEGNLQLDTFYGAVGISMLVKF